MTILYIPVECRDSFIHVLLTHWGRVTHICVSKQTIIGSDNSLSPGRRQAIIWTNAGILLIGPMGTNFSEILIEIHTFSFKKMRLKISSGKWRPCCLGLNVLILFCWRGNHFSPSTSEWNSPKMHEYNRVFLNNHKTQYNTKHVYNSWEGLYQGSITMTS